MDDQKPRVWRVSETLGNSSGSWERSVLSKRARRYQDGQQQNDNLVQHGNSLLILSCAGDLVSIGQGLQKRDDCVLLLLAQTKVAQLFLVQIGCILGSGPARNLFARIRPFALGQHVASVIKVDHLFEAFEVAV